MRKTMKLGAASTLAAVALLAGSASAASAFGGDAEVDPYVCGNSSVESGAGEESTSTAAGYGPVTACQVGKTNIFNNNQNGDVSGGDIDLEITLTEILDTVTPGA
jgi:hypothetical protein